MYSIGFFFFRDSEMHSLTAGLSKGIKRTSQPSHIHADKLKSINDQKSMSKKIQLCSTPKVETVCNGISKRKCDEQNEVLSYSKFN